MSIRRRRRERARNRLEQQRLADIAVKERCKRDFNFAASTFGGTVCPECLKPVPPRALYSITGMYGEVHLLGSAVRADYCHTDQQRCIAEAQAYWGRDYKNIK